jgi:hypothetical protein
MKRLLLGVLFAVGVGIVPQLVWAQAAKAPKTDADIKQQIITQSIASYSGSCPCPYNADRAGRRCGRRSAYSRPRGASPLCYAEDVTQKMVDDYRSARAEKRPPVTRAKRQKGDE